MTRGVLGLVFCLQIGGPRNRTGRRLTRAASSQMPLILLASNASSFFDAPVHARPPAALASWHAERAIGSSSTSLWLKKDDPARGGPPGGGGGTPRGG